MSAHSSPIATLLGNLQGEDRREKCHELYSRQELWSRRNEARAQSLYKDLRTQESQLKYDTSCHTYIKTAIQKWPHSLG